MKRNQDYWFAFVICLMILMVGVVSTYETISSLLATWNIYVSDYIGYLLADMVSAVAGISICVYAILFLIYNFMTRKPEIAYRGSLIGLGAHSICAGIYEVVFALADAAYLQNNPARDLIRGILVIITGAGLIYAAVTKYAAKGRNMALSMSMMLSILYVVSLVGDIALYHVFKLYYVEFAGLLVSFVLMSVLAYRRKTFVVYY